MEVARAIYIAMALVSIVPLILFNIRRIWVRRPPEPMKFKPVRFTVILLICVGLGGFLFAGYQVTLHTRYEIATERGSGAACTGAGRKKHNGGFPAVYSGQRYR